MKKLRTDGNQGMLAIIRCRIFGLPVQYQKISKYGIQYYNFAFYLYECETLSLTIRDGR